MHEKMYITGLKLVSSVLSELCFGGDPLQLLYFLKRNLEHKNLNQTELFISLKIYRFHFRIQRLFVVMKVGFRNHQTLRHFKNKDIL